MPVWEQLQELSDSQFLMLCLTYGVTPQLPIRANRYWLARRLHAAIVTERARWRGTGYERARDRSAGYPAGGFRWQGHRHTGGNELHFGREEAEEQDEVDEVNELKLTIREQSEDDEEEEQEQRFPYDYEEHQALQQQQEQQEQQQQQQQQQIEQMRVLQLHQQRQLQHLEQYLAQLEEERLRTDQIVAATWSYQQQQLEQMQKSPELPPDEPHGFQSLGDPSSVELLPQRTMMDLAATDPSECDQTAAELDTDYLTASSGLEIQQECEVRTVIYLTREQLSQIMKEKQMMLDNDDGRLAKLFSRTHLLKEPDNIGDAPAVGYVPCYRHHERQSGFWDQFLDVLRSRTKLRIHDLRYTIVCCALAVCTFVGAKFLK